MSLSQDITNLVTATNNLTSTVDNKIAEIDNHVNTAIDNVVNAKSVTYYVDALNGNDNNDGSSGSPFQTIGKACDSVPAGGSGAIYLKEGQTFALTNNIGIHDKKIKIFRWGGTGGVGNPVVTSNEYAGGNGDYLHGFYVSGGTINFASGVDILVPGHNGTNSIDPVQRGLFVPSFDGLGYANISFHYCKITLNNGFRLIDSCNWGGGHELVISQFWGTTIEVNYANTPLINLDGGTPLALGTLQISIVDNTGNNLNFGNLIGGVVKDSNGVPRNVLSGIIL